MAFPGCVGFEGNASPANFNDYGRAAPGSYEPAHRIHVLHHQQPGRVIFNHSVEHGDDLRSVGTWPQYRPQGDSGYEIETWQTSIQAGLTKSPWLRLQPILPRVLSLDSETPS